MSTLWKKHIKPSYYYKYNPDLTDPLKEVHSPFFENHCNSKHLFNLCISELPGCRKNWKKLTCWVTGFCIHFFPYKCWCCHYECIVSNPKGKKHTSLHNRLSGSFVWSIYCLNQIPVNHPSFSSSYHSTSLGGLRGSLLLGFHASQSLPFLLEQTRNIPPLDKNTCLWLTLSGPLHGR